MTRMITYSLVAAFLAIGLALWPAPASADNITLTFDYTTGIEDTMVANYWPTTPLGNQELMYVYHNANWETQSLIRFDDIIGDQPGQIPFGSTINSATLRLYVYGVQNPDQVWGIYQMNTAWDESTTWNSIGGGVTPGQQASANPVATATNINQGFFDVDLYPSLQAWADGSSTNYGWAILETNPEYAFSSIYTSEAARSYKRPVLTVNYTPAAATPEPGTLLLLASSLSAGAFWRLRRRKSA